MMGFWRPVLIVSVCTLQFCAGVRQAMEENDEVLQADSNVVEKSTSVTFKGGGFLAHAAAAGFVAGLTMASNPMNVSEAMKDFDAIGCNSGGCWFSATMLWSQKFNNVMEDMARRPQYAQRIYYGNFGHAIGNFKEWSEHGHAWHPVEVSCCQRKGIAPCGSGLHGHPWYIKYQGVKLCCPREVVKGCRRKGLLSCGSGMLGKPHEVFIGQTPYCCPEAGAADAFNLGDGCLDVPVQLSRTSSAGNVLDSPYLAFDWQDIVGAILEIPGDFDSSVPLSTRPLDWAVGKDFILTSNVVAPAQHAVGILDPPVALCESGGFLETDRYVVAYLDAESSEVLNNWTCIGPMCGAQVPARFSVSLGAGSPSSPLSFTSTAAESALGMVYGLVERKILGGFRDPTYEVHSRAAGLPSWEESYMAPIKSAVGSSSAAAGLSSMLTKSAFTQSLQKFLPTWLQQEFTALTIQFSAAKEHMNIANFRDRQTQVKECTQTNNDGVDQVADGHVVAMSDGGPTDATGVAHLVAAGHTNIIAVINGPRFKPENPVGYTEAYLGLLSGDGSGLLALDNSAEAAYPIFAENFTYVRDQMMQHFKKYTAPAASRELDSVWVGELKLTTIDSAPFGIVRGQSVTLRMVIASAITLGFTGVIFAPAGDSIFGGEIVETFAQYEELRNTISSWAHGV